MGISTCLYCCCISIKTCTIYLQLALLLCKVLVISPTPTLYYCIKTSHKRIIFLVPRHNMLLQLQARF